MLSFIGWSLLSILTFGIGFLFLYSYMTMASAIFYNQIKESAPYEEIIIENVEQTPDHTSEEAEKSNEEENPYQDLY